MTSPVAYNLRINFPKSQIIWLSTRYTQDLVKLIPGVDKVISCEVPWQTKERLKAYFGFISLASRLRKEGFDLAVIPHRTSLGGLLAWVAGIPWRVGFESEGRGFALTHKVDFQAEKHEVERNLGLLEALDLKIKERLMKIEVPAEERQFASEFLENLGVGEDDFLVVIAPGGGENPGLKMPTKRWPVEKWSQLVRWLTDKGLETLIIGGPGDIEIAESLLGSASGKGKVGSAVGKTTILQSLALIERADLFIGHDSGTLHLAAALGIPTVSLFGPTNPHLVAPQGDFHISLWHRVECAPCYEPMTVYGEKKFLKCEKCKALEELEPEEVIGVVEKIVRKLKGES